VVQGFAFQICQLTRPYPAVQDNAATLPEKDSHEKPLDQAQLNCSNGLNFILLLWPATRRFKHGYLNNCPNKDRSRNPDSGGDE
jgi:hypothetical protein